jgi:hypothetical protein
LGRAFYVQRQISRWADAIPLRAAGYILWGAALLLLPITSLPLLVRLTSATTVAPPSSLLFLILGVLWLVPHALRRGRLPVEGYPLLVFFGAALASTALAFFYGTPPFRGQDPVYEGVEGIATLLLGLAAFFLPAAWLSAQRGSASNARLLRYSLVVLNLGGLIVIVWSLVQAQTVLNPGRDYPGWVKSIQEMISIRTGPLFLDRVTGLAYEPSWLAHQLNLIYIPFWLASVVLGFSAHSSRRRYLSLELVLLLLGVFVLTLSFSRVGLLSLSFMAAYLAIRANLWLVGILHNWLFSHIFKKSLSYKINAGAKIVLSLVLFTVLIGFYITAAVAFIRIGAQYDWRLALIANTNPFVASDFYHLTNNLVFAERAVYWATGWGTFNDFHLFGVGLNHAGFYFQEKMPAFGWALTEVTLLLNYQSVNPNTKSMWVRILVETGLVGFSIFLAWYYLLWQSARLAVSSALPVLKMIGLAGKLVLISFLIEGFSVDSFALPYFWFAVGMLAAAASVSRQLEMKS